MDDQYTVGEVARLSHASVRTLHHYDAIGLLTPSARTPAGYRIYDGKDLERLRRILFYRALDFGLDAVAELLDAPDATADDHLRRQHRLLREQVEHRRDLLRAIEKEMEARAMGMALTPEEQFEIFGTDRVGGEWAAEAEQRWGDTDAYRESRRRTAGYTKQDWAELKREADRGLEQFRELMVSGAAADGPQARALAEAHRQYLIRWFYDCDHAMHRGMAELYIADERFAATFDALAPGLARFVHDAIIANAAAHDG